VGIESVTATVEKQKCTVNPEDDCIIYLSQVSLMANVYSCYKKADSYQFAHFDAAADSY